MKRWLDPGRKQLQYNGQFLKGDQHGKGVLRFRDGSHYKGDFRWVQLHWIITESFLCVNNSQQRPAKIFWVATLTDCMSSENLNKKILAEHYSTFYCIPFFLIYRKKSFTSNAVSPDGQLKEKLRVMTCPYTRVESKNYSCDIMQDSCKKVNLMRSYKTELFLQDLARQS